MLVSKNIHQLSIFINFLKVHSFPKEAKECFDVGVEGWGICREDPPSIVAGFRPDRQGEDNHTDIWKILFHFLTNNFGHAIHSHTLIMLPLWMHATSSEHSEDVLKWSQFFAVNSPMTDPGRPV